MRLLTEATGQVLTRNVAADRSRVLGRETSSGSVVSCGRRRGAQLRSMSMSMSMPMAILAENQAESAWSRSRRTLR